MKVTFCVYDNYNTINGVNAWLRRLLPELKHRGMQIQILSITWASAQECTTLSELFQIGVDCREIPLPYYTEKQARWILKTLAADPPDVFVPGNMLPGLYAGRWLRDAGIPTVAVLHNNDKESKGILSEFVFGEPADQLSAIVCVSQLLEHRVLQQQPQNTLVRRIPCGAPLPQAMASPPTEKLRLAYVGRLVQEHKRIIETTRALCRAVQDVPNTEAVIYGSGPDQAVVEQILQQKGRGLPIHLAGRVDSEAMQAELLKCHGLVLLSDSEGLPVSVMEAMACGVVPICLRIESGIPELVEDGVTGLLVGDRGDDFVTAVRRIREDPGLWQRLSRRARSRIEAEYSHDVCANYWEKFLRELHTTYSLRRKIQVPHRLNLPPVNPNWAAGDCREPPLHRKIIRKLRLFAGNCKQRLSGV